MCVEENDLLFFSTGMPFKAPTNKDDAQCSVDDRDTVVSGYKVGALLGRGGFGEVSGRIMYLWIVSDVVLGPPWNPSVDK